MLVLASSLGPILQHERTASATFRLELATQLGEIRLSEARLAGFPHANLSHLASKGKNLLRNIRRRIGDKASLTPHENALLVWLSGDIREAAARLKRAATGESANIDVYIDLAAAFAAEARLGQRPTAWIDSLAAAHRAVERDLERPESMFNLALALERLSVRQEAAKVWVKYLALDPTSPWAEEARAHLAALALPEEPLKPQDLDLDHLIVRRDLAAITALINQYPQELREYVEEELLYDWSSSWTHHQFAAADKALAAARFIGEALAQSGRGSMAKETVEAVARSLAAPSIADTAVLAAGHRYYSDGRRLHDALEFDRARKAFAQAEHLLREGQSPFASWARLGIATCDFQLGRYQEALVLLKTMRADLRQADYPSLFARMDWIEGLVRVRQADPVLAAHLFERALSTFSRLGEAINTAALLQFLAETLMSLGDREAAWASMTRALSVAPGLGQSRRAQAIFGGAAQMLMRQNAPELGVYFESEAHSYAVKADNDAQQIVALISRARMNHASGQKEKSLQDLQEARLLAFLIADDNSREDFISDVEFAEGEVLINSDPVASVEKLTNVLNRRYRIGDKIEIDRIYLSRAAAYRALRDVDAAESDLVYGIQELSNQAESLPDETSRILQATRRQELADRLLELQIEANRERDTIFLTAEEDRSRALLQRMGDFHFPLNVEEVQDALPSNTILIEYAIAGDHLVLWMISKQRIEMVHRMIASEALERNVRQFADLLFHDQRSDATTELAVSLYADIMAPIQEWLTPGTSLVIVPDKFLARIPFAALKSSLTGRFVVEDHPIVITPSATFFLRNFRHDCEPSKASQPLLIGNPAFDRSAEALADLPQAIQEVRGIAHVLNYASIVTGVDATKKAFFLLAPNASFIHLAAHGITDEEQPLFSRFLLAKDRKSGDSGTLYAHEIYHLDLHNARLAFLSSCSTADGLALNREGQMDLVRPFLAAGVPAVIGSLWGVRDGATKEFVNHFYLALSAGSDPAHALREAQLEQIDTNKEFRNPGWNWAAFQLYGRTCAR